MKTEFLKSVEKWEVQEVSICTHTSGNPFLDDWVKGTFTGKNETVTVDGFYDGEGIFKVRFMPSFEGEYSFEIQCSFEEETIKGSFMVTPASEKNHGPVRVCATYHFAYEDGTPYYPVGTTCYVWELQTMELQEQTLATLKQGPFNKIRFCIFPKHYDYNFNEPFSYPFEGTPMDSSVLTKENFGEYNGHSKGNCWDFARFNPKHFQHIERRINDLKKLGIEADLIVMHPYDRWGFSCMDAETDDRYWKYVIARFAAYRNVWWSLANEYDFMEDKTPSDWERYAQIVCDKDPYHHLRSVHNGTRVYDFSRPWVTHCSVQRTDLYKSTELTTEYRQRYKKPVVWDEICYEGNIEHGWGNISGQELTRRFWEGFIRGGYPGHGETYLSKENILWWSHGGVLHGTSPSRIAFMRKIMEQTPGAGMEPLPADGCYWDSTVGCATGTFGENKDYLIFYYGVMRPSFRKFQFPENEAYKVEVIDTWNMTIEDCGVKKGQFVVSLPGREYMAIRLQRVKEDK